MHPILRAPTPTLPRASLLWHLLVWCAALLGLSLVGGVALGAWAGGPAGAVLGGLVGPAVGCLATSGWLSVGFGVRLILPPRAGGGAGSTLLIALTCGWLAALLGLGVVALIGAAVQAGLVGGAVCGLLAGLALDVLLYD